MIEPSFGSLNKFEAVFAYPEGKITVKLKKQGSKVQETVILPKIITGTFKYDGTTIELHEGLNKIK